MTVDLHPLHSFLPKELSPGALLRKPGGAVYYVCGSCLQESTGEPMVLYKALDSTEGPHLRASLVSALLEPCSDTASPLFTSLAAPDSGPLRQFWKAHFEGDFTTLDVILQRYAEPWRLLHTPRHLYRIFELARSVAQPLSREEGLALLFHRISLIPGASLEVQSNHALLIAKSLAPTLPGPKINWEKVSGLWDPKVTGQVHDLLLAPVSYDLVEFCINEELGWLESRAMFPGTFGRKDYETARLTELIRLASQGPLYTKLPDFYEKRARVNVEGLRQAWRQKYAK